MCIIMTLNVVITVYWLSLIPKTEIMAVPTSYSAIRKMYS